SIFGALAWRCAEAYGEAFLEGWLEQFLSGKPPFLISDAMPGDWFPAPLGPIYRAPGGGKLKPPVWVRQHDFLGMLREPPGWTGGSLASDLHMTDPADRRHASLGRLSGASDETGALFEVEQRVLSALSGEFFSLYLRAPSPDAIEPLVELLS